MDLYLIHWPLPGLDRYVASWRAFVELRERGLARSIGVSNFTPAHVERIERETGCCPPSTRSRCTPTSRRRLRAWCAERGIVTESWSPLAPARRSSPTRPSGRSPARTARTPAQVVLRWHLQAGSCVHPEVVRSAAEAQNLDVFGFELDDAEMAALAALDRGHRQGGDPDVYVEM